MAEKVTRTVSDARERAEEFCRELQNSVDQMLRRYRKPQRGRWLVVGIAVGAVLTAAGVVGAVMWGSGTLAK